MRPLSRIITTIVTLAALFFLASPYFIGEVAQKQLDNQIQGLNQKSPYITITLLNYQHRWFNSTARLLIDFHSPKEVTTPFHKKIFVDAIIKNGPLINIHGSLHVAKGALIIESDTADFDGSLTYMVDWRNRLITFANIPFLKFTDSNGNVYTTQSLQFNTTLAFHHLSHTLTFRDLCILIASKQPIMLDLDNVMVTSNRYQPNTPWLNTMEFFIESGSLMNHVTQVSMGHFKKLTLNALCSPSKAQKELNFLFNLHIQSLTFMKNTIKPIILNYGIQNINADRYKNFMTLFEQAQNTAALNSDPNQAMNLLQSLAQIVESGLSITINRFYLGLPKNLASSPLSMHGNITFDPMDQLAAEGLTPPSAAGFMGMAPLLATTLIKKLHASGELSLPQNLVREGLVLHYAALTPKPEVFGDAAYTYLVTHRMLIPNGTDSVNIIFNFDQNKMLINGQKPALQLPMPTQTIEKKS